MLQNYYQVDLILKNHNILKRKNKVTRTERDKINSKRNLLLLIL